MTAALAVSALALLAAGWARFRRGERSLVAELSAMSERVCELTARVEAAEASAERAVTQVEIAESLLLEKGIADEEDLEAMRQRFDGESPPPARGYVPRRDGDLH
jgi:hypothetical protein